jgi:aspartate/glutamate racemase
MGSYDLKHWRGRADQMRIAANNTPDVQSREIMHEIAASYDRLADRTAAMMNDRKLAHPHVLGTNATANQNGDEYLQVYTDLEMYDQRRAEYDEKLQAELVEAVRKYIGKGPPFEGRFAFKRVYRLPNGGFSDRPQNPR